MKKVKILAAMAMCAMLTFSLTACNNDTEKKKDVAAGSSSAVESSSTVESQSSVASEVGSSVSSAVEESGKSASSAAEASGSSEGDASSTTEKISYLPQVEVGDEAFKKAIETNPIDEKYNQDLGKAASVPVILEVTNTATVGWQKMIESVNQKLVEAAADDAARTELENAHANWQAKLETDIQAIKDEFADDESTAELMVPERTLRLYRERGIALCEQYFKANGELPSFDAATGAAQG